MRSERLFWVLDDIDPARPALISGRNVIATYRDLSQMVDAHVNELRKLASGLVPLVLLDFATTPEAIAAYLAALRCGFPVLLCEPGSCLPGTRIHTNWTPDIHLRVDETGRLVAKERSGWREETLPKPHPDLRLLLSTSGSTGEPKLVRLSGKNIASNAAAIAEYLCLSETDRAATTLPLFYSYGLSVLNSYLSVGAALVLTEHSITEPAFFAEAQAAGVTSLALVPYQFDLLVASGFVGNELKGLRYVTQAGGKLSPDMVRKFAALGHSAGWKLVLMYGQTEAAPRISYVPPTALPDAADTIGKPIPGGRIWLEDEHGHEILGTNQAGELVYEGPNVMMGYASNRADLAIPQGSSQLKTGDIAERTEEGFFRIIGRMKRFVKLFGLRLSLDQIELTLRESGIAAHAIAVDDRLVLLLRDKSQTEMAQTLVADYYGLPLKVIHAGFLKDGPPLLPSGKIDQKSLESIAARAIENSRAFQGQVSATSSLADTLRFATRNTKVGPDDTFNSLGGDSLSYLIMQLALEERLGAAPIGWENMQLSELEAKAPIKVKDVPRRGIIGGDLILRLIAIALIVIQHSSSHPLFGGTWILIAVMGFSVARFQSQQIREGRALNLLVRMLYPILPLYFLLLIAYGLMRSLPPPSYFLLLGNYEVWSEGSLLIPYWFVSLYAQIVGILALIAATPSLRLRATEKSWRFCANASLILIFCLLLLVFFQHRYGLPYIPQRGLLECLSVFFIGWMIQAMKGVKQILVSLALTLITIFFLSFLDMSSQVVIFLVVALLFLALRVSLPAPRWLAQVLVSLGLSTLYVYLFHQIIIYFLVSLDLAESAVIVLALGLSFTAALLVRTLFDRLDRFLFGRPTAKAAV